MDFSDRSEMTRKMVEIIEFVLLWHEEFRCKNRCINLSEFEILFFFFFFFFYLSIFLLHERIV